MANYYATTRSNYFRVKDAKAFEAWCKKRFLDVWTSEDHPDCYAIAANDNGDGSGWPHFDSETDDDIDFTTELAEHLDERDVAVLFEIGNEKLRYLVGVATAVNSNGRSVSVNLDEIYDRAKATLGSDLAITEATY
jgi:hypothetical protein